MVYVYSIYLDYDKPYHPPVTSYQMYLDEQRRRRHREPWARPLNRARSIERELDRQKDLEHLREIRRTDRRSHTPLRNAHEFGERFPTRYPQNRFWW